MNASHLHLYRYTIPFTEAVTVNGHRLLEREGIIVALKSAETGLTGYGEIAPLPGLHHETLRSAEEQLVTLLAQERFTLRGRLPEHLFPSVRTGLEMAIINLEAALPGVQPSTRAASHVPLNALLFGDTTKIMQRAEAYFRLGYRTFKLKVPAANTENAIRSIRTLHQHFGTSIELRLDANQSFRLEEALEFARNIPAGSIAYIEEPLKEAREIGEFHAKTRIPSALDETLWQEPELLQKIPRSALAALILKPNRLGGISTALHFARYAREHNLLAVFSSAFESGISLSCYTQLAASNSAEPAACGLDTYRYLKHDLLVTPFGAEDAQLNTLALCRNAQKLNYKALKPLSQWSL